MSREESDAYPSGSFRSYKAEDEEIKSSSGMKKSDILRLLNTKLRLSSALDLKASSTSGSKSSEFSFKDLDDFVEDVGAVEEVDRARYWRFKSAPDDIKEQRLSDHILKQPYQDVLQFYDMKEELGAGVSAVVSLCVEKKTGTKYACKSIEKSKVLNIQDLTAIRTEVEIMREVGDHAGVVTLKEVFEDEHSIHMISEYCQGGELYHRIIKKKLYSERDAARVCRVLVSVLSYCHSKGIIHRDVKPENVLLVSLTSNTNVQVTDFGHACYYQSGRKLNQVVGTAYYIAPEVLKCSYGPEADLWSLGVILYVLLGGMPPFRGDDRAAIFREIESREVSFEGELWSKISDTAVDLLKGLLTKDPAKRTTASEVKEHPWVVQHCTKKTQPLPVAMPVAVATSMAAAAPEDNTDDLYIAPAVPKFVPTSVDVIPVADSLPTAIPIVRPVAPERVVAAGYPKGTDLYRRNDRLPTRGSHQRAKSVSAAERSADTNSSEAESDSPVYHAVISRPVRSQSEKKKRLVKCVSENDRAQSLDAKAAQSSASARVSPQLPRSRPAAGSSAVSPRQAAVPTSKSAVSLRASAKLAQRRRHRSCGENFWGSFDTESMFLQSSEEEGEGTMEGEWLRRSATSRQLDRVSETSSVRKEGWSLPKCVLAEVPASLLAALHQKPVQKNSDSSSS